MKTDWAHLPNAAHIDRVLVSYKTMPGAWAVPLTKEEQDEREESKNVAWNLGRVHIWYALYDAVIRTYHPGPIISFSRIMGVIAELLAYDDCGYILDSDLDEVKILAALGNVRASRLVLTCIVLRKMKNEH